MHRQIAIASLFLLAGSIAPAADIAGDPEPTTLRAITYNVQFLPGLAALVNQRKDPVYRAQTIAETLSAQFDLVCLNEVFDPAPKKLILEGFQAAWPNACHIHTSPKPEGRYSGGLAIISRYPFLETHVHTYEHFSDPKDYGVRADGFAAKGVLHARIWRGDDDARDDYVDVFATHMEARDDAIRELQYPELAGFIAEHSDASHPALLLGDMNTRGNREYMDDEDSQYHRLMKHLRQARPESELIDLWPHLSDEVGGTSEQETSDGGRRIDYVFLFQPKSAEGRLVPQAMRVSPFPDARVGALSDHNAVEADFQWPPRQ